MKQNNTMSHSHSHHNNNVADKNISMAFILNAVFVIIELIGGILTNSIAIMSDAFHDFGDCLSLATAWSLQRKSRRGRDSRYSYGYKRFSLLGSIFLSGVLTVSSIYVIVESVGRLMAPQPVNASGMLWMAIFGIVINGAAALKVKKGTSLNERAVYLHIMEDVLGWIGVLIVSVVMFFVDFPILDSLLSLVISIWVLINVYRNMKSVFYILLQGVPQDIDVAKLTACIKNIDGIEGVHDLHIWSLDGESHVMTVHIVSASSDPTEIRHRIDQIAQNYHINHTTIEFENPNNLCQCNCDAV